MAKNGPLSPLLRNLVLDELDRELERRGHRHVRYADDCNIYVRSERAGHRVMKSVTQFITQRLVESRTAVSRSRIVALAKPPRSHSVFLLAGRRNAVIHLTKRATSSLVAS